jgi:hypothetical protein
MTDRVSEDVGLAHAHTIPRRTHHAQISCFMDPHIAEAWASAVPRL